MLNQMLSALINGLTYGMSVFVVAAGITLVFGILKILNFAHGSFLMIGAYVAFTITGTATPSLWLYVAASLAGGAVVGLLGYIADLVVLRPIRKLDEATSLIATFALLLICDGVVKLIWGLDIHIVPPPDELSGAVMLGPIVVPKFSIFTILLGLAVFAILDLVVHRLWIGKVIQALANDSWMSGLAGINVPVLFTCVVVAAFALVGLAGGLLLPNQSLSPGLSASYILQAFVVVIIGGLGNIRGAFLAALLLGCVESLNSIFLPAYPGFASYLAMVAFLLWRPQGLLSGTPAPDAVNHSALVVAPERMPAFSIPVKLSMVAIPLAFLISMPMWSHQGLLFLAGLTLIDAVYALSWNLLYGVTGLVSFGHAAFFAVGAYLVGFALKFAPAIPFLSLLIGATCVGGALAFVVGFVAIRRTTGIALAILTLALCEILRMTVRNTTALGADDGLTSIPRPSIDFLGIAINLKSDTAYFWFLCVVCAAVTVLLWCVVNSEFGRVLRCIRQDAERAEFLGINVRRCRLTAFVLSGAVATFAGGLQAGWLQIVIPETADYLRSTQPVLNTLLGGADFFWGPLVGSVIFAAISYGTRSYVGVADVISGVVLLAIVLAAPGGVLGIVSRGLQFINRRPMNAMARTKSLVETAP